MTAQLKRVHKIQPVRFWCVFPWIQVTANFPSATGLTCSLVPLSAQAAMQCTEGTSSSSTTSYTELFRREPQFSHSPRAVAPSSPAGKKRYPKTNVPDFCFNLMCNSMEMPQSKPMICKGKIRSRKKIGRWKLKENCQTNDGRGLDSIFDA